MPCSSQDIFAWTGAVLINIGFIFGIVWGSVTAWYFGATLTAVYAGLLFCGARRLEQRQERLAQESSSGSEQGSITSTGGGGTTLLISLLYGQAILAMGVAGFFIPFNVVGSNCSLFDRYNDASLDPYERWVSNATGLASPSVLAWMEAIEDEPWDNRGVLSSFVYLPGINTTVFNGVSASDVVPEDDDEHYKNFDALYIGVNSAAPERKDDYRHVYSMVAVTNTMACFRAEHTPDGSVEGLEVLGCYDGATVEAYSVPDLLLKIREVRVFNDDTEGLVWYYGPPNDGIGVIFVSVDVNSKTTTVHSVVANQVVDIDDSYTGDQYNADCSSSTTRLQALCLLFASVIPVFVASLLLWRYKSIASTGLTSLVGFVAAYSMIVTILAPSTFLDSHAHAIGWLICGALYCLAYLPVAVFDQSTPPLRWGSVAAAVSYLTGLVSILFFLNYNIAIGCWVIFLVAGSVPLTLLGLVSDNWLITLLGAGVALTSSVRLCVAFGDAVSGMNFFLPVFISLAITGLLVGGVGYLLGKYKAVIKQTMALALSPLEGHVKALMGESPLEQPASVVKEKAAPVAEKDMEDVDM